MGRSVSAAELNTFVAGFITEASPLTFPANATLDEANFVLNRDGSRIRRLGMDAIEGFSLINTGVTPPLDNDIVFGSFKWENAGGNPDKIFIVVQIGPVVQMYDAGVNPISDGLVHSHTFSTGHNVKFGFAGVDGMLVVATGQPAITVFEYTGSSIKNTNGNLKVRDMFGVEDIWNGENLRQGSGVGTRPTSLTDNHLYNLRNQTWGPMRLYFNDPVAGDPVYMFSTMGGNYPSNADNLNRSLFANTANPALNDSSTDRYQTYDSWVNPPGSFPAPTGYFIIDALSRGSSRISEYKKLVQQNAAFGVTTLNIKALPLDQTPGGANVVAEYGGRAWYAGFSGQLVDGDIHSPRMASYVLFSQLVDDPSDIFACYQSGDPTSKDEPELLDTDGGFIRIDGAYGISGLISVGDGLMVVAANGIWMIQGGSDYGFKATNYLVTKITNYGCDSPGSIVPIDNTFMYWSDSGIYRVAPDQFGDYKAESLTERTIQTFYDKIDTLDKIRCNGIYDAYNKKVRWVYGNRVDSATESKELIFDLPLSAFYNSVINQSIKLPIVVAGVPVPPFRMVANDVIVTVNGNDVTVNGEDVTTEVVSKEQAPKDMIYLVVTGITPVIQVTFATYHNTDFVDWQRLSPSTAKDAEAYMVTGWMSNGDYQRSKQVPYITFHFNKTEQGFEEDEHGDFVPTRPSSCFVSAHWDWSNSANSGKWGREFQAYRFKRHWMPESVDDSFDNGYYTVVTRNKLRGQGKVLSMKIRTEPKKDCHLLGWSMSMSMNGNV